MNEKINPGYGYELCEWNDPAATAFFIVGNIWQATYGTHRDLKHRRPIKPPVGLCAEGEWVLLPENEPMRNGDVFMPRAGAPSIANGWIGDIIPNFGPAAVFRRVDKPEVKLDDGWRETAKEKPGVGDSIWAFHPQFDNHAKDGVCQLTYGNPASSFTHWKPAIIPAPPVVKSDAEKAWEEAVRDNIRRPDKGSFIAGFNAAKK